jgi:hypothetical protein
MASTPKNGPTASGTNAHCQPTWAANAGTKWIVSNVNKNPVDV